ncbi:expressed unknown protein [Seminavis robusta]|uniref:Uncharacterized protein n=1 Tax=Seminavis robusta TaxID=568900 RepID=A0A9N8DLJ0_9STRA|nr:expressed unknown protein [Seminavis robusta]|eukprot:Sro211_g087920.1 n/a (1208) ;mRNA; f:39292-42915
MTPREYQELHDSFNLFDEKMGFLQLSQSTNDMVSEEVRNFGEQRTDHRRRRSATSLEVGSVHNNSQRKSFPVNEHRGKRRTGRKSTGQSTKNNTTNESPARRRDRSTSNSRDRSNSNSRDRSTSTTRSGGSSKIRGRSSSVANKRNSHSRQNSKSSLSTKKTASKSPKRSSSKEHTNTTIPKPSLQRNKSGPGRLQDSSKNLDYNDANEEEEEEEEEVPPRLSSSKRVSSSSSSNKKNRGRSRKQRSSLPANEPRSGPKKVPPEASPSPSVRKSKNTALHLFDRSVGSEESFFAEEDDPTRRLVKEAGYLEASEYISNSRSVSQSRAKRDDKNNNNASSSTMRSVSLSRKKDHGNNNTSASSLRSGSLSRKKDDRNNTSSSTLRSGSLSRKKDDRNNNTSSSTLRSGSVSRNSVSRNNTSSSTLRSASQSRAKRDDKNSTSASSLRSASLSRAKREDRNHSSASSFRSQSLSRAKREDRNHSSASSLRSQSLSRAKNEDKNNTSASTLKSGSITTGSKEASRNDEDDFKIIRSASLSRPKGVDDYKDDKNKKRSSSIMSRKRESAKSSKDENDSSGNNPKSTAPRKKESSGKTKNNNNNNNNKSLKRIGTYFPKNEPRGGLVRRRSFTDASSILIFDDEDASIMSDERSVGTRQTILDILASPTTSRPKLSFPIQRRVPSQPHPEHLKRKSRTATAKDKTRSSSKSKRKSRAQGNMPTAVPMTPSRLPNLLAPHSDDEHEDGHDSHKNLLENISISDIMSPVKSKNLLERIAKDAALALTDRWHTVPVGATPAPETSGKNSANNNSNGENSPEPFVGFKNNDDTQDETEEEAVPPVRAGSAAEREARRRSRRERIKEKTGGGEVRKRRSENVTSPKRRERKHSDAMMSKSDTHFSVRRRSTAPSAGQRRQSASRSRSRSNSRSLSRSARLRPRNSLAANPEEQANFHRRAESIFTPKLDNDDTGGESDVSDRMEHEIKPEPPRRTSLLTMQTLYGGGRVETGVAEKDDSEQGERGKRSASLGPTRNSQRKLPVEEDLDVAQHSGSRMLSSVSDTGYRMRTASTGRASRRRLFDSSGALDTEAVKRGGRNRLAKERKSRTSSSDLENDFNKSDMELSHESASTLKSNAGSRGSNKSGSTHHQNQRRRRHTVAKDQLHKSISTIPDLEPMEEEALVAASAHSKAQKLDSISEQVWQRRRRASSVGRDEI